MVKNGIKFLFDRLMATIGLIALWWLLLLIALFIKLKSKGESAFFTQERIGKDGQRFRCHKFRTMKTDDNDNPITTLNDPRIEPWGIKLRRYKLDELPQLWDVLIGKMSFVGPRPDVPGYADRLRDDDRKILKLRPGITGPATLKYRNEEERIERYVTEKKNSGDTRSTLEIATEYNDTIIYPDKVRLNRYYLNHHSFLTDMKIIFATLLGTTINYAGEVI